MNKKFSTLTELTNNLTKEKSSKDSEHRKLLVCIIAQWFKNLGLCGFTIEEFQIFRHPYMKRIAVSSCTLENFVYVLTDKENNEFIFYISNDVTEDEKRPTLVTNLGDLFDDTKFYYIKSQFSLVHFLTEHDDFYLTKTRTLEMYDIVGSRIVFED